MTQGFVAEAVLAGFVLGQIVAFATALAVLGVVIVRRLVS